MPSSLTFSKKERLKSEKVIKDLFEKGSSFYLYPFKIFYLQVPDSSHSDFPQVLISVSKRNFKRAVDRNRIKRLVKESYRLNKIVLKGKITATLFPIAIGIMYVSRDKLPFSIIQNKLILAFDCFEKKN